MTYKPKTGDIISVDFSPWFYPEENIVITRFYKDYVLGIKHDTFVGRSIKDHRFDFNPDFRLTHIESILIPGEFT